MRTLISKSLLAVFLATLISPVLAGPGHDHGDEAPIAVSNGPKRQPDGNVFLPKLSQRQLAVRTVVVEKKNLPQAFELVGRVVMDPNAGGMVQPTVAGRIEAGPKGLPSLGQQVRQGEVLAYVRASTGAIERANQTAQAAELRSAEALAEKRLARLIQLEGSVPQKEIEAAQEELQSLNARLSAVNGSLGSREALVAPVTGVIASSNIVAGQVVDAREVVFEIIDPNRLRIEAIAHDASLVGNIASASARTALGESLPLEFVGAGLALREQTVPVQFRIRMPRGEKAPHLAVGQPVKVVAQSKTTIEGVAIPASAIVKSPSNLDIVWVHTSAEQFAQRPVRYSPLDAATVAVIDGLNGEERVVVQGAPLVNQVR